MNRKYQTIKDKDMQKDNKKTVSGLIKNRRKLFSVANYLYYIVADYGESYAKPLGIVGILALSGIILFVLEGYDKDGASNDAGYVVERIIASIVPYISNHPDSNIIDYILKAATLPFIGISFIALKRRFERKYRH